MPHDTEDMIQLLLNTNKEQEQTIVDLWNIQRKDQAS